MGYFDIPVDHVYCQPVILDYLASKKISSSGDLVVVSPDVGGVARARAFAKKLSDAPLAIVDKRRQGHNVAEVMNLIGDVKGKVAVMVDYMIDTAVNSKAILEGLRVKKHKRPRASLERTTSEASLETTPELMRSASESSRQDSPPAESPRLRLLNREFREIPLSPIVETGNRHESRPVAGQDDNREMSYPEAAEVAMAGLHGVANFMNAGLAKYQELAAEHEATKAKLSAAEAKAKTAESKAKSAAKREAKALSVAEEAKKKIAELEAGVEEMKAELCVE